MMRIRTKVQKQAQFRMTKNGGAPTLLAKTVSIIVFVRDVMDAFPCMCTRACVIPVVPDPCRVPKGSGISLAEIAKFAVEVVRPPDCCYRYCAENSALSTFSHYPCR
jgi:hypothetical protein